MSHRNILSKCVTSIWTTPFILIIICDFYIVPYSATPRPVSTQHISPKGVYNACCHYRCKALLKQIAIASCHISFFNGRVNQLPHDSIAANGASNIRPFGYESYALTNCAIRALRCLVFTSDYDKGLLLHFLDTTWFKKKRVITNLGISNRI